MPKWVISKATAASLPKGFEAGVKHCLAYPRPLLEANLKRHGLVESCSADDSEVGDEQKRSCVDDEAGEVSRILDTARSPPASVLALPFFSHSSDTSNSSRSSIETERERKIDR